MPDLFSYLTVSAAALMMAVFLWTSDTNTLSSSADFEIGTQNTAIAEQDTAAASIRMVVAPAGNTVRYLVREQLAGFDFPNDAVGETDVISGAIVLDSDGEVIADQSGFVVNITGLKSDRDRRDNFIQRNTLESEQYPTVELAPFQTRELPFPLPTEGEATFDIIGYLTVRDVTQPTSWRVNARFGYGVMAGTARTEFTFEEFEMEKPRVGSVLSVADAIRLEYDFTLNIESLTAQ
jgi:polyisoprenoid-binding protein YceI